MRLLIIRHAEAEDVSPKRPHDADRRLTEDGREKMTEGARGLLQLQDTMDLVVTSRARRAVETAEIVSEAFAMKKSQVVELPALSLNGTEEELLDWLAEQDSRSTIALVGHEPNLSVLISLLLSGQRQSFVVLKKGAVWCLDFAGPAVARTGRLQWGLTLGQLRKVAN